MLKDTIVQMEHMSRLISAHIQTEILITTTALLALDIDLLLRLHRLLRQKDRVRSKVPVGCNDKRFIELVYNLALREA
jgi:hypothetical protein